jgi:Fe-S-cluster-containing dehydrogenase component
VVNREESKDGVKGPIHLKVQCMHCERPGCVSACLVGAMRKDPKGAVHYDASRCIGCRYCLMACPFERLAYEYEKRLTPRVAKCDFCRERTAAGGTPACVEICPVEALTFGCRSSLLELAHEKIRSHPEKYIDHVYGEHEVGGTSWLYLSDRPFEELGFPTLGSRAPAATTEAIQHGIFRGFAAPIGLVALLGTLNAVTKRRAER